MRDGKLSGRFAHAAGLGNRKQHMQIAQPDAPADAIDPVHECFPARSVSILVVFANIDENLVRRKASSGVDVSIGAIHTSANRNSILCGKWSFQTMAERGRLLAKPVFLDELSGGTH